MADPVHGSNCLVKVASAAVPATFVTVENLNQFSANSTHGATTEKVFGKTIPLRAEDVAEQGFTVGGFVTLADAGMQIIADAEVGRLKLTVKVLFDGTNGFSQECMVTTSKIDANPKAFVGVSCDFVGTAARVVVGVGFPFL